MSSPDVIVLGVGGMGAAACRALARRGAKVLGIEQFELLHARGSSHGQSRILRKAYFEHPDYVPLLERAYGGWSELEAEHGATLFERCGLLLAGDARSAVIAGTLRSASDHALPLDVLDPGDVRRRFPAFVLGEELTTLFERDAGLLHVEACVGACIDSARRHGVELLDRTPVRGFRADAAGVEVTTVAGTQRAARLVVTGGAWTSQLLAALGARLRVQRQMALWFRTTGSGLELADGMPTFGVDVGGAFFYGFPSLVPGSIKLAEHGGGEPVSDPSALRHELEERDVARVRAFARAHLVGVTDEVVRHSACMYTLTPDEHFVLDMHPAHPNVCFAAGLSGHGFKFAPVIGEVLADLALDGRTEAPIGFLSAAREAIRS